MDTISHEVLSQMALPNISLIALDELEQDDELLHTAKKNRSLIEYYFTCTPSLLLFILNGWSEINMITYLDADLFFFAPPDSIYEELGSNSILIIEHRFPSYLRHFEKYGIYNVGLLSFRRDKSALRCLHWWRERCLEWCYDRIENDRFADQKYLDDWPARFPGVKILEHKGAGLAPWNVANHSLLLKNGQVLVDSQQLIFYHFHDLEEITPWLYNPQLATWGVHTSQLLKQNIYGPYIRELHEAARCISMIGNRTYTDDGSIRGFCPGVTLKSGVFWRIRKNIHRIRIVIKMLLQGQLFVVVGKKLI